MQLYIKKPIQLVPKKDSAITKQNPKLFLDQMREKYNPKLFKIQKYINNIY